MQYQGFVMFIYTNSQIQTGIFKKKKIMPIGFLINIFLKILLKLSLLECVTFYYLWVLYVLCFILISESVDKLSVSF